MPRAQRGNDVGASWSDSRRRQGSDDNAETEWSEGRRDGQVVENAVASFDYGKDHRFASRCRVRVVASNANDTAPLRKGAVRPKDTKTVSRLEARKGLRPSED